MGTVLKPWTPIQATENEDGITVKVWGREYRFGRMIFPQQIITCGKPLLDAPIRAVGLENHEPVSWHLCENWIMEQQEDYVILNAVQESRLLVLNAIIRIDCDGYIRYQMSLSPRGFHIRTGFDVQPDMSPRTADRLWLEIPLANDAVRFCHNSGWDTGAYSGAVKEENLCFKPINWYGNDDYGLGLYADSDENWQNSDRSQAVQTLREGNAFIVRWRLLDRNPHAWEQQRKTLLAMGQKSLAAELGVSCCPLAFDLSMQATPIKPYDNLQLRERIVHIDCFSKIYEDYVDFLMGPLSGENPVTVMDHLRDCGVTILTLHEKWNDVEGYWRASPKRAAQVHRIIEEAHKRNIRVMLYFCSSVSTLRPEGPVYARRNGHIDATGYPVVSHYRQPPQRTWRACANGPELFRDLTAGMAECVTEFDADGVYIDSADIPWGCANAAHGCGYTDENGQRRVTYPVESTRRAFKKIYEEIHEKMGKMVHVHSYSAFVPAIHAYADLYWDGEQIAFGFKTAEEVEAALRTDTIRAEYLGRNIGVFSQFLAYELPDNSWNFQKALSIVAVHGVFPRPNDVHNPLSTMLPVWNALREFNAAESEFLPYWKHRTGVSASHEKAYVSAYAKDGERMILIANPSPHPLPDTEISLLSGQFEKDMLTGSPLRGSRIIRTLEPYSLLIWKSRD